ncbi:MAG TPA: hypothetical protein VI138_04685 [Candidatus Dormibacteraeota bacterium]
MLGPRWRLAAGAAGISVALILSGCGAVSPTPRPTPSHPSPSPSATGSASGFEAASVTFVSATQGWALGTAPCAKGRCLAVVQTDDAGASWSRLKPPPTGYSEEGGVDGIRFADSLDGWAFGSSQLWATHDAGASWTRVEIPGWPSADFFGLETADGVVYLTFVGSVAQDRVRVASSPVGSNDFTVSPTSVERGAGPVPYTELVVQGAGAWLLQVDRTVIGGAQLAGTRWTEWAPPCVQANGAAVLAASSARDLFAVCDQGVWGPASPVGDRAWVSSDGGSSFSLLPTALPSLTSAGPSLGPIASPSPTVIAIGDGTSILASFDGGGSWSTVFSGSKPITYLGFTTPSQGVAISSPYQGAPGSLLMTHDGGHSWAAIAF